MKLFFIMYIVYQIHPVLLKPIPNGELSLPPSKMTTLTAGVEGQKAIDTMETSQSALKATSPGTSIDGVKQNIPLPNMGGSIPDLQKATSPGPSIEESKQIPKPNMEGFPVPGMENMAFPNMGSSMPDLKKIMYSEQEGKQIPKPNIEGSPPMPSMGNLGGGLSAAMSSGLSSMGMPPIPDTRAVMDAVASGMHSCGSIPNMEAITSCLHIPACGEAAKSITAAHFPMAMADIPGKIAIEAVDGIKKVDDAVLDGVENVIAFFLPKKYD